MHHFHNASELEFVPAADTYPLFLAGDEGLKPRRHSEAQLVYERRLVLGVDLNFDPRFERSLVCWREAVGAFTTGTMISMHTRGRGNWAAGGQDRSWRIR